jgi:hypothetical protein
LVGPGEDIDAIRSIVKDFVGAERFGVIIRTPQEFLDEIGAVS